VTRYYFDHNATTPVSREVLEAFTEALKTVPGNASSVHHFGQEAKQLLERSRRRLAALLNAAPGEVVFTSGGTEADNLAVLGALRASPKRHLITSTIEHPAVLAAARQLEREGVDVTYVPVGGDGLVDPDDVRRALRPDTALVSVMHANNETGVLQPIAEMARIAHAAGALMHSDGVQATGKIAVDVRALGVDLYSVSGHKFYAPKGCGALYARSRVKLAPLQFGGRHERERRPGTENVPGAAALASAADWAGPHLAAESARLAALRDRLERGLLERVPDAAVNGSGGPRVPNTTNIRFDGLEGESMVIALDLRGFAVSTGAACSSGAIEPSHVLIAMGLTAAQAKSSLRFSLGRENTAADVDALIEAVAESAAHLRNLSPVYGR
jgi:cysteine desulfurase